MTKSDLISQVSNESNLTGTQAAKIVNHVFELIGDALQRGEDVRITGFGTFRQTETKSRPGRNPRTGERIEIPASKRVTFGAGSGLIERVRRGGPAVRAA